MVSENSSLVGPWIEPLRPVAEHLVAPLSELYRRSDQQNVRSNALLVLTEYRSQNCAQLLAMGLEAARPSELAVLAPVFRRTSVQVAPTLRAELARPFPATTAETDKDAMAKRRANAGILLCLIGAADEVWPTLAQAADPRVRTNLIHGLAVAGVDPRCWCPG